MKNILKYSNFINEHANQSHEMEELVKTLTDLSISTIYNEQATDGKYKKVQELEVSEPFLDVDFKLLLRKEPSVDMSKDPYFKKMKWQHIKMNQNDYAITGNTFMTDGNIPEVEVCVVIDSDKISKDSYSNLYYSLTNTITHELNHLNQKGWNRDHDNIHPSSKEYRKKNGKKYSYFILPEEIESMVKGLHKQSESQNIPLDQLFDEYLDPFVEADFMNQEEKNEIINKWINHALKYYPDSNLTDKYQNIINNI